MSRIRNQMITCVLGPITVLAAAMATPAAAAEDAILVLDGSGSMWGQIEGKTKIEIAQQVTGDLLNQLPGDRRLGLIAYGHNRKGDCTDIEELVAVGTDRGAIKAAVDDISPKGKTPLSAAVKMAAEKLRYTESKATVILVSDGIETCDLDPCAVGTALEEAGVDFTAHVIGFDVAEEEAQQQLQCLAKNTGGRYISASNAGELSVALTETVVNVEPAAETGTLSLAASELEGGPKIESGLAWTVQQAGGGDVLFEAADSGSATTEVPAGVYDIFVERSADGLKGKQTLVEVPPGVNQNVLIALRLDFEASVRAAPEPTASAGSEFVVYWEGPNRQADFVTIARKDMSAGGTISYKYVTAGNPVKLTAPTAPGTYEVRYVLGKPYRILAREDFTVTEVSASVTGPETAMAGAEFTVDWTGPDTNTDYITITEKDAPDRAYKNYAYTRNGSPAKLTAPLEPGDYEIRYAQQGVTGQVGASGYRVLASAPISVTAAGATLTGPESAAAGRTISIPWTGPKQNRDYITIVKPDAPDQAYNDYAYTRNGSPAEIKTPLEPGAYEVRYVQDSKKVLTRTPITITAPEITMDAPSTATAGQTISIAWTGPVERSDFITVTPPDFAENRYTDYAYTRNGNPAEVTVPSEPGTYEVRFVLNGKKVILRSPLEVSDVTATLTAPDSVAASSKVSVDWTGPNAKGDWLAIVKPDAPPKAYGGFYAYSRNGSPATINAPKDPGDYEIRYVLNGKRVVARRPITVTAAE